MSDLDPAPEPEALADLSEDLPDTARLKRVGLGIALGALLVAVVGIGWRHHATADLADGATQAAIPDVAVVHAAPATGTDDLVLPGAVQAWNSAAINARTNGYVKAWRADIGDHVRTGQALAVLDAPEVDQQLAQAEADYQTAIANQRLAETTARRWAQMLKQDAVSQQEADEKSGDLAAKSALANSALANVKRLRALQGFERVYAPFDGVVTSRSAQIGALVVTGNLAAQPLFTVSDVHRMRVYVRVPQSVSAMVRTGITASLMLPEFPSRAFDAVLTRSANAVDPQSGAVLVELQADNPDQLLKPGAFAQVHFHAAAATGALILPGSAILYGAAGPSVVVVGAQGRVDIRPIHIARDNGNSVAVIGAIGPADRVVDTPPDAIRAGEQVNVVQTLPQAADPSAKDGKHA